MTQDRVLATASSMTVSSADELPPWDPLDVRADHVLDLSTSHQPDLGLFDWFIDAPADLVSDPEHFRTSSVSGTGFPTELIEMTAAKTLTNRLDAIDGTTFLSRLRKSEIQAEQSANFVIDALCAIPQQMLRRATLPPFIHPQWHCSALPEPLAVCMRIAQLFASRTPEIESFIWRTILSEQRRIVEQAPHMSKENLLAAIQAHMVYLTMRLVGGTMDSSEWNWEMATSHVDVCNQFLALCGGKFCEEEQSSPSQTWDDWIFAESRRRSSCVWFLISRTILVKTKSQCPTTEQPWTLPLPAPKSQWEAKDSTMWYGELEAGTPGITTLGELLEAKEKSNTLSYAQSLDAWNARTDNLGFLLNVAMAMV